ncbi:Sarcosine oxidase gamma subunit [hydrothermal vent metagenome]|uniref:Sarcosine oxidase gamma subunit n=1 Tax=hydrothermal vent metagenome TaxID=652676 RepID=A0A3B0SLW4_9ZZZZ
MSDIVSALENASYEGFAKVEEAGLRGMITLRGNLASVKLKNTVKKITGVEVPRPGHANVAGESGLAWMSPDELLVLVPYEIVENALTVIDKALKGQHYLAVNVSDARAVFCLSGPGAREVIAKLCPMDMSAEAFKPGQFRRTRMAQIPAASWMGEDESLTIICFRSVADYVFNLLKNAAEPGSEVGYLTP